MKIRVLIAVVLAALAASMLAGSGLAGGGGPGPATKPASQSPYFPALVNTMDASADSSEHLSMARDPLTGRMYIAFYDPHLKALRLAAKTSTGQGNCGDGNTWYCATIESPAVNHRTGISPSIAIYHGQFGFRVGIAYIDTINSTTSASLRYAQFYAAPGGLYSTDPGHWTWDVQVLDDQQDSHPSLKIDTLGAPHVAFEHISGVTKMIRYASPSEGSSGFGCVNTDNEHDDWDCDAIISANTGHLPSLGIGADNIPRIAYYYTPAGTYLSFAIKDITAPGNPCGDGLAWRCTDIIPAQISNLGLKVYTTGGGSYSHIAYIDGADDKLKYALYVSAGSVYANCGYNAQDDWMCATVTNVGPVGAAALGLSIDVDRTGYALIAYEHTEEIGPSSLYLAQAVPGAVGNCPGSSGGNQAWVCNPIAVPGPETGGHVWIGASNSLVIDNYGMGALAYTAYDDYYGYETTSVHLAAQKTYIYMPMVNR